MSGRYMLQNASSKCNWLFLLLNEIMLHTNFSHIQSFLSPFLDITHSLSVRNSSEHTTMVDNSTQLPK